MSCCCFATISTSEVGVIEKCGKFSRLAEVSLKKKFAAVGIDYYLWETTKMLIAIYLLGCYLIFKWLGWMLLRVFPF